MPPLQISHGAADEALRHLQGKLIPGLQKGGAGLPQPLAHRTVNGLPEIAALGVLHMSPARH